MTIKQRIEADLKSALLGGDKTKALILRGLKSSILNAEIAQNKREQGLDDESVVKLMFSELKKRQETIDIYRKAGNNEKAAAEEAESVVIKEYLPEQMDESELLSIIKKVIQQTGATDQKQMGQVIKEVMVNTKGQADGGLVARLVKEQLS